ncbi:Bud site selection protein bud4, partial [Toensbergia leucococca]|nr:Bud site selection protein bud4 [Toensbergia leucococca]
MSQAIQPLRIQKNAIPSSPNKMSGAPVQRPLAELSPMERRRNSPSYNQNSRKIIHNADSSPFDSSPFASNSPRLYWQHRDSTSPMRSSTENKNPLDQYDGPPSPTKRSSIENLKRASRVKNSNMFAREHKNEYDPTSSPVLERPLATGRPLGVQVQENGYGNLSLNGFRKDKPLDSSKIPVYSPNTLPSKLKNLPNMSGASSKPQVSPTKSSLSGRSRYTQPQAFDPENGIWSEDEESFAKNELPPGKTLHRHAKSVTFDAAPPQINEYEMTTPDPSSVASGSREGSYESAATEEEESFDRGSSIERDDSFDASLEDTDKTPVVLPEDWRFMSPGTANDDLAASMENPFDGRESSPAPLGRPDPAVGARPSPTRTDSAASSGERRPLPPLPALGMPMFPRARSDSNNSLLATAERVSSAQRTMPSPPRPASISKSEIQGMGGCSMSIEDRLRLMMNQDEETSKSPAEEQRERRLRRAGTHSKSPERGIEDEPQQIRIHEDEVEVNERANLGDDQMRPRISRESILRKVKGQLQDVEHEDYDYLSPSPTPNPARDYISSLDPDTPLPSLEGESFTGDADGSVFIKQEDDEESEVDVYSIPDLYSHHFQADTHMNAIEEQVSFKGPIDPVTLSEEDDESHYSDDFNSEEPREHELQSFIGTNDDGPPTPRAEIPGRAGENLNVKSSHRMSLPQFASMLGEQDFGFGFESFMTPSPPLNQDPAKSSRELEPIETVQRPITPDEQLLPPRFPGNVTDFEDEPKTPESVIRYPPSVDSPRPESPIVPEPVVTIKASDGKLKTRPSLTPADIQAMADTRRHVSNEAPSIPAISESPQAPSVEILTSEPNTSTEATVETSPGRGAIEADSSRSVKRKSSLVQLEVP